MRLRYRFIGWFAAGAAGAMLLHVVPAHATETASRTPRPTIERADKGDQCIAAPAIMRRDHMDMLKHQRDQSVRGGIRGAKASLKECVACHASAQTGSVAKSETNFCVSCHAYTAVKIDCFECHATRPAELAQVKPK